jgi:hypothetical protein
MTELDFVLALRHRRAGTCCGPLVRLPMSAGRIQRLEHSFQSRRAVDTLWDGLAPSGTRNRLLFDLCVAHWMDLSYLTGIQGRRLKRRDWVGEGSTLLDQACRGARWDAREMANMMKWQRVLLT